MNSNSFVHESNSDREGIISCDDAWEEEWDKAKHEKTMMFVVFSNHIMNGNTQSNGCMTMMSGMTMCNSQLLLWISV